MNKSISTFCNLKFNPFLIWKCYFNMQTTSTNMPLFFKPTKSKDDPFRTVELFLKISFYKVREKKIFIYQNVLLIKIINNGFMLFQTYIILKSIYSNHWYEENSIN